MLLLALALVLSQEAPEAPAPAPAPAAEKPAEPAAAADSAAAPAQVAPRSKGAEDVAKLVKRLSEMSPDERAKAMANLQKQYGAVEVNPVMPPAELDASRYADLPPVDQARVTARHFFNDLINADAGGMLSHCGLPFQLEDRRVDRPEELRADWVKALRGKRTDLLRLYDVEVLTAAEMEKKYGPPPRRLSSWSYRGPNTYLAVANLSGHATVLLLKQQGLAWQVVAYHD